MPSLAIVIPAYKPDYLEKTLDSLAKQSCRDFSVYIGDDASPYELEEIALRFQTRINLHYTRFTENYGGNNLVSHWNRCLTLCQDEEWICIFSDDDLIESNCIQAFHNCQIDSSINIVHFNIDIIDENDRLIRSCPDFPSSISADQFFDLLFKRQIVARMPEYIFRRSYLEKNGLVSFDLAWRSDTATVIQAAHPCGILSISGDSCRIKWRASSTNISGLDSLKERKNQANIQFFNWVVSFFDSNKIQMSMSRFYLLKTIAFELEWRGTKEFIKDGLNASNKLIISKGLWRLLFILFLFYRIIYRRFEI